MKLNRILLLFFCLVNLAKGDTNFSTWRTELEKFYANREIGFPSFALELKAILELSETRILIDNISVDSFDRKVRSFIERDDVYGYGAVSYTHLTLPTIYSV